MNEIVKYAELTEDKFSELQQMLNDSCSSNNFYEDKWVIIRNNETVNLDFGSYFNCENSQLDLLRSKIIFLYASRHVKNKYMAQSIFIGICKLFLFLKMKDFKQLSKANLKSYFEFILMHRLEKGTIINLMQPLRLKSSSYDVLLWNKLLRKYELPLVADFSVNASRLMSSLKSSIKKVSNNTLTYRDWKDGGSYNYLTLDYGQFFIDHNLRFFHENILLALAIKRTLDQVENICNLIKFNPDDSLLEKTVRPLIVNFVEGKNIDEVPVSYIKILTRPVCRSLEIETRAQLRKNFRFYKSYDLLFEKNNLETFIEVNEVVRSDDTFKKLKYFILFMEVIDFTKSNFNAWYRLNICNSLSIESFKKRVNKFRNSFVVEDVFEILNIGYFEDAGINKYLGGTAKHSTKFLKYVEYSGLISFAAYTGWRASEFGFSYSDIQFEINKDILDSSYHPITVLINGLVPKTHGDEPQRREITSSAYCILLLLSKLINAGDDEPALYSKGPLVKHKNISSSKLKNSLRAMWPHYVENYELFKNDCDPVERQNNHSSSLRFFDSFESASSCTKERVKNNLICKVKEKATKDFKKLEFALNRHLNRDFIWKYINDDLSVEHTNLLNEFLSEEVIARIKSIKSRVEIDSSLTRFVLNELKSNALYATPHALRHMWAECVYRRFDGDVGWAIRSNFKHISQRMWETYIEDKSCQDEHKEVKRRVISSILAGYIRNHGKGYAGAFDSQLKNMFIKTEVFSENELISKAVEFGASEIEDIKSTPWGFCLLQKKNQENAQCSIQGVPRRHNASPGLCLNCINNIAMKGNIEGILLYTSNEINLLNNPKTPRELREPARDTVKRALIYLNQLGADSDVIKTFEDALNFSS